MKTVNWKKTQERGWLQYVLVKGLIVKGGISAGLFSIAAPQFLGETATFGDIFPTASVVFPLAGALANLSTWPVNEWAYRRLIALETDSEPTARPQIIRFRKRGILSLRRRRKAA